MGRRVDLVDRDDRSLTGVAEVYDGAAQLYPQSAADVADFKVDASTPVITEVDPASLTWGAEETVTKDVEVTVVNLGSNALTVDNDAIAPFTAVVNGTTVTVTPPAPNTTSDDIVRTMTVSVAAVTAARLRSRSSRPVAAIPRASIPP